jgi:hypothetical protein
MGDARVVAGGLHAVVPHEALIALGESFLFIAGQLSHGCAQMVGAMLHGNASDLPERLLNTFRQGFKGFAEAHAHGLDIGVREHKVVEQVRKDLSVNRHVEARSYE